MEMTLKIIIEMCKIFFNIRKGEILLNMNQKSFGIQLIKPPEVTNMLIKTTFYPVSSG